MNKYLKYIVFVIIVIITFSIIQAKIYEFLGVDAYYHAKVTQLILDSGNLVDKFPWLQYTILNDNFVEHHLLFHIILLPFFKLFEPFLAAKLAVVLFSSAFFIIFLVILKKLKIKYPIFWTLLLLFSSSLFIYRLNLLRAQSLALILLIFGIYCLLKKKYLYIIPITILYTWLFDGFIILGIVIAVKAATDVYYFIKTKNRNYLKDVFHPGIYYLCGITIAIILNPYFPRNIYHLFFHLYQVALKDPFSNMPVGVEWHMATPNFFISSSFIIIVLLLLSIFTLLTYKINKIKIPKNLLFLIILAIVFFFLTIMVRKLIEYCAPMIVLLAAYLFTLNFDNLKKFTTKVTNLNKASIVIISTMLLAAAAIFNFQNVYTNLNKDMSSRSNVSAASNWIKNNIPLGEIIYHADWSESAPLLFHNDKNYYISGLDPNFMKDFDGNLYLKWHQLFTQNNLENAYYIIRHDFNSNYVYLNKDFDKLIDSINKDPRFKEIYQNESVIIFKLQ